MTPPTGLPRVTGGHRAVEGAAAVDGAGGAASPLRRATDVVVGMADLRFSTTSGERLITYALGSCLGIAIHDPVAGIAGLLHVMLPESAIDAAKAASTPAMFVDTGVPAAFAASIADAGSITCSSPPTPATGSWIAMPRQLPSA